MKSKLKKGAQWIDRTLLESPYCIGLCQSETQYKHELKRLKINYNCGEWIPDDKDANVSEFIRGNEKCYVVSIRVKKDTQHIEVIGLLIHEAVHVWQKIRDTIGEESPSPEFEAYSIQRIAQNLIDAYRLK
jgi:hypothetical protein